MSTESIALRIEKWPERLVRVTQNVQLVAIHEFFLTANNEIIMLPRTLTEYNLGNDPPKLKVSQEEYVEAVLNSWILLRLHYRDFNYKDYICRLDLKDLTEENQDQKLHAHVESVKNVEQEKE
jgi:hypothetical protein